MRPRFKRVVHDADDLDTGIGRVDGRLGQARDAHDPPHGVASVQARAFERLVDQRNLPSTRDLGTCEQASLEKRNAQRPGVVRADLVHDERLIVGDRARHLYAPAAVAERVCARIDRRGRHAGDGRDAAQQLVEEEHSTGRFRVSLRSGKGTLRVKTCSGSKPRVTRPTASTLLIMRLAPTISMIDSATAPTTRLLRSSTCAAPPVVPRPLVRRGLVRSRAHVWSAGARPKIRLVAADTMSVNISTGRLTATSDSSGMVFGGTSVRIIRSAP